MVWNGSDPVLQSLYHVRKVRVTSIAAQHNGTTKQFNKNMEQDA